MNDSSAIKSADQIFLNRVVSHLKHIHSDHSDDSCNEVIGQSVFQLYYALQNLNNIPLEMFDARRQLIGHVNEYEENIQMQIHQFNHRFVNNDVWQINQASVSLWDTMNTTVAIDVKDYNGTIGCCFTGKHRDLVALECIQNFTIHNNTGHKYKNKQFASNLTNQNDFILNTNRYFISKAFLPVIRAYLILQQTIGFVRRIVNMANSDSILNRFIEQLYSALEFLFYHNEMADWLKKKTDSAKNRSKRRKTMHPALEMDPLTL